MEYSKFRELIKKGENSSVDFKIICDAFDGGGISSKGELAKDICAMANNGARLSYIVIGVSDNGKTFKSVDSRNLSDDTVQDFCKKAIFPPPKLTVHRVRWNKIQKTLAGKEFVVIQIGPNPRQVFRLAQDFIDYKSKTCLRRNEVWIRRNATTDLATPEEIVRLSSPTSRRSDDVEARSQRKSFAQLSQSEQKLFINAVTQEELRKVGYKVLRKDDRYGVTSQYGEETRYQTLWNKYKSTVIIAVRQPCQSSLTRNDLEWLAWTRLFDVEPAIWQRLPNSITRLTRKQVRVVRRLFIIPILHTVSVSSIAQALPTSRRLGTRLHFYRPYFHKSMGYQQGNKITPIASSSELLIVDGIKSVFEYQEELSQSLGALESETSTIVRPK